jgi:hypothetical protein
VYAVSTLSAIPALADPRTSNANTQPHSALAVVLELKCSTTGQITSAAGRGVMPNVGFALKQCCGLINSLPAHGLMALAKERTQESTDGGEGC